MIAFVISMPDDEGKKYEQFSYPGGEVQVRLLPEAIAQAKISDHLFLTAKITDGNPMPLALLTDAIRSVKRMQFQALHLPYLPYSRADRRFVDGDCKGLKVFADVINDLSFDSVYTLDVHSDKAEMYVRNLVSCDALPYIEKVREYIGENTVILLPDAGAKRYLEGLGTVPYLQCSKLRDPKTGKLNGFSVPSAEELNAYKNILIVDDICDGGGTFIGIAKELHKTGAYNLFLYVSHGIFSKGFGELALYFDHIFTTDSYCAITNEPGFVTQYRGAP